MVPIPRQPLKRRLRRSQKRKRPPRRRWSLAALALAGAALWWLWPAGQAEAPPPPTAPQRLAHAPVRAAALLKPITPKRKVAPTRAELPEREKLLAAVRERASTLRECALPGGALARLPLRLHVASSGAMRSVDFTGDAPPAAVVSCVRKTAMGWSFEQLKLPSDVELLVAVSFAPGA